MDVLEDGALLDDVDGEDDDDDGEVDDELGDSAVRHASLPERLLLVLLAVSLCDVLPGVVLCGLPCALRSVVDEVALLSFGYVVAEELDG